jgi:hypothetical protein
MRTPLQFKASELAHAEHPEIARLQVSIPCQSCAEPIGFAVDQCPTCSASVPNEIKAALLARLEASSSEFRELRNHTRSAITVLDMVSGFLLLLALISSLLSGEPSLDYLVFGVVFAGLALVSRRKVFLALTTAVILWTVNIGVLAAQDPRSLFSFPRAIALVMLLRGSYSAASARLRLKEFTAEKGKSPNQPT